jgi:hypothetical protein
MGTYFNIPIGISKTANWYQLLTNGVLRNVVEWQKGHFHITSAFILNNAGFDPKSMHFDDHNHFILTLDKLEVFQTGKGNEYVVAITSSNPMPELIDFIFNLRNELISGGCDISQAFRLHITLGKVNIHKITLEELKQYVCCIDLPSFQLKIDRMEYIRQSDYKVLKSWNI